MLLECIFAWFDYFGFKERILDSYFYTCFKNVSKIENFGKYFS